MRREYSKEERIKRACLASAQNIRRLWEEKGSSHSRLIDSPIISDDLTTIGRSRSLKDSGGKGYREHVIPCILIVRECHEMLLRDETDEAIAKFIEDHTKIVHVSREEANKLNRIDQLGLRQKMPKDWVFGGDPFGRLVQAGIEWDPI